MQDRGLGEVFGNNYIQESGFNTGPHDTLSGSSTSGGVPLGKGSIGGDGQSMQGQSSVGGVSGEALGSSQVGGGRFRRQVAVLSGGGGGLYDGGYGYGGYGGYGYPSYGADVVIID